MDTLNIYQINNEIFVARNLAGTLAFPNIEPSASYTDTTLSIGEAAKRYLDANGLSFAPRGEQLLSTDIEGLYTVNYERTGAVIEGLLHNLMKVMEQLPVVELESLEPHEPSADE